MRIAIIATSLALLSTTLAVPANNVNDSLQKQIQALEISVINVINDLVQSSPSLKSDYRKGLGQLQYLVNRLQGPQFCSTFGPPRATTRDQAIQSLQLTNQALQTTSLLLLDPSKKVGKGDFYESICSAGSYYLTVITLAGLGS